LMKWKSDELTQIETRKSRDIQVDNDYKKINIRKIYHISRLFVSENYQSSKKSAYMVYFSHIYFFVIIINLYISTFPSFN
jgi:hypothetical protein